ncbi:S-layer homology domain-containing protein [Cohnella rhizosphaerae]|uniref:S-layer homology domain-containing protein n=1 Tax=Cohnella rhizosphaerae TaxID=1457232 RepID=A0A9X4L081_9BACL|nr:S-layer homology domain-containing protein [Cohnella rhizosphaerae]MDG0814534.1 S-layer homology domain-containing protein [Cohnella rhizosphaerae]
MKYIAPAGKTVEFQDNRKTFADIASHWGKSYIDFVAERELFVGVSDLHFAPNAGMTRAMLATVIGRLYESSYGPLATSGAHVFTDADYDSWYGAYLDWAASSGIIQGVGGNRFDPDRQVTRQETAAMLYRFAQYIKADTSVAPEAMPDYSDASSIEAWARQAVLYGQQAGIFTGRGGNSFAPKETATRAEVAAILQRFIETIV